MLFTGKVALGAVILGAATAHVAVAATQADAATPKVSNPRHAHVVKRGVTHNGRFKFRTYDRKVYVHGRGWKRTVFVARHRRVVDHWRTKRSICVRFNMRVAHGKGAGHRMICRPRISREQRLRQRIIRIAKSSLSSRTGFYRYNQPGQLSSDMTPPVGYRSDCSQWTRSVYLKATGRDIGWNTWAQAGRGHRTSNPKPGDLMFGATTGHVEIYLGHGRTIGHGSPPIDYANTSYWPGHYFVTFL